MVAPLLETKLYRPKLRSSLVPRPRLVERLDRALDAKLTLVSGPPGFGKTTLISDWLSSLPETCSVAWLSLDAGDNDPLVFWRYVFAALQRAAPGIVEDEAALVGAGQAPSINEVLTGLLNKLAAIERDIVLVLDDYHVIDDVRIHEAMTYLLENLVPRLHLVVASRADPPLPLARLRARGELVEVRTADLRFRPDEATAFCNDVMGLELSGGDLRALEGRTEGWIAALQLAALSLQGREDASGFIEDFAGDNRYIVDYLLEEVLQKQPEPVRQFLLETSILDRLGGDLCEAVTGQPDSLATLRYLEDANVFLVPLDDRRRWFRYHHLFADVLHARLAAGSPGHVEELHRRASQWFAANGEPAQAIRHSLAARDFEHAADLLELALPAVLPSRQDVTLRGWLDALPEAVLRLRPVLSTAYVSLLLHGGEFGAVERRLQEAEDAIATATRREPDQPGPSTGPAYVDEAQFRELPGMIALYRAGLAQVRGHLSDTVKYARLALERMAEDAPLRGGAMALLGLALWASGEIDEAYRIYAEGIVLVHKGGYINDSSTIMVADMRVAQGRLREALDAYRASIRRAEELGQAAPRGVADLHVGISEVYREQGDLDAATEHLSKSRELGEAAGLPENRYRWFVAMADVKQSQGDFDGALALLDDAERLYAGGFAPDLRPIPAFRARVWVRQGRMAEASAWARERGLVSTDELTYLREFEHVTLARLLLGQARANPSAALMAELVRFLEHLLGAAEAGGRGGAVIEILVLLALARQAQGEAASARDGLSRALAMAEPEGYVRVFADESPQIVPLLEALAAHPEAAYARRILSVIEPGDGAAHREPSARLDALSERELDVLRLLATDLSGPEIARELVVSLNTVRTHTKSIYTKLGVNSRRAAIRRAEELKLL